MRKNTSSIKQKTSIRRKSRSIYPPNALTLNQFIIICFDEASILTGNSKSFYGLCWTTRRQSWILVGLLETDDRKVFRAIRRALRNQRKNIVGIFADTNSSIGDLVPTQDEDDSVSSNVWHFSCYDFIYFVYCWGNSKARDLNLHAHRPFVHIASTDCLRFGSNCPLQVSVAWY